MGQTSYVYILWLVILGAGLWAILSFGSLISAREDLAGDWQLTTRRPIGEEKPIELKVEQSGRYFKLTMPNQPAVNLKMTGETVIDQRFGETKRIVLQNGQTTATFEGLSHGDLWAFTYKDKGEWIGRLVKRTYPRPTTQPAGQSRPHAH